MNARPDPRRRNYSTRPLLAMLDVHTAGRGLASYGVHSFTQLAAILLMPVLLFIVCDQFTKPTRRS